MVKVRMKDDWMKDQLICSSLIHSSFIISPLTPSPRRFFSSTHRGEAGRGELFALSLVDAPTLTLPLMGREFFIASFLMGTAVWHIVLFAVGLLGFLFYPVMLALAGGVMVASMPHLCALLRRPWAARKLTLGEGIMLTLVVCAALLFVFLKGAYPSGAHDFFNHYFPYYREVVASGNLGPHATWYHYFYSKGLGLYFMSMILMDPLAVHLVGATFIIAAACMVFDILRRPGISLLLPLFGALLYFLFLTYTRGRGLFAANGAWGDLEKTHELGAVLLFGCIWLARQLMLSRNTHYTAVLAAVTAALSIISFPSGMLAGLFIALMLGYALLRKDMFSVRQFFFAGAATGVALLLVLIINYCYTGVPLDYFVTVFWPYIDWKTVMARGFSLELFATLNYVLAYEGGKTPLLQSLPMIVGEYYRLYMFWPLLVVGALMALLSLRSGAARMGWKGAAALLCFLLAGMIFALLFGGRSVPVSFFRFSSFNYAPVLVACLMLWGASDLRLQKYLIVIFVALLAAEWLLRRGSSLI